MWDKSKKLPNLCSKIAPASPGVSDKKSPAPGGLGASIPRPRPRSGGGGPGASGGLAPGVRNSNLYHNFVCSLCLPTSGSLVLLGSLFNSSFYEAYVVRGTRLHASCTRGGLDQLTHTNTKNL